MKPIALIQVLAASRWAALGMVSFACLLGHVSFGQPYVPGAGLKLRAMQSAYVVGEPIVLTLTITNGGSTAFSCQPLGVEFGYVKFFVGEKREYGFDRVKDPTRPPVAIPPGGERAEDVVLHFDFAAQTLTFPTPGKYMLRAEYRSWSPATSPSLKAEIALEVVAPEAGDAAGSVLFAMPAVGEFVADSAREEAIVTRLKNYIQANPESVFGRYAAFYAGQHELRSYADRPANPAEAERLLSLCDRPGFQLRPPALLRLAQASRAQGQTQKATEYIDRVLAEPGSLRGAAEALKQRLVAEPPVAAKPDDQPVSEAIQAALATRISEFFTAYIKGDLAASLAVLDPNFEMRGVVGKEKMAAQLREEFGKANRLGAVKSSTRLSSAKAADGGVEVAATITFFSQAGNPSGSQEVRLHLMNRNGNWFISKWLP
jgi:hypothetical protein